MTDDVTWRPTGLCGQDFLCQPQVQLLYLPQSLNVVGFFILLFRHGSNFSLPVVICPAPSNKTSNSIPSAIKGDLDRRINISIKSNQMLLAWRQVGFRVGERGAGGKQKGAMQSESAAWDTM